MRSISHYEQKLTQSKCLSDIERNTKSAYKQIQTDMQNLKSKRDRILDSVKKLDRELAELPTIQNRIANIAQAKVQEIMSDLAPQRRTYKKRQTKKVNSQSAK